MITNARRPLTHAAAALLLAAMLTAQANAAVETFDAVDRGWYNHFGNHTASNVNYTIGNQSFTYHNFFVFDLAPLAGKTIVAGQFVANTYSVSTDDGTESFELRHIATPIATLVAGGSGLTGIYDDLADGTIYGSATVGNDDDNIDLPVTLNAAALADLNNAIGGLFAFGGHLPTLDASDPETVFNGSGEDLSTTRLVLTVVPEQASALAILALGGVWLLSGRIRRPRAPHH